MKVQSHAHTRAGEGRLVDQRNLFFRQNLNETVLIGHRDTKVWQK